MTPSLTSPVKNGGRVSDSLLSVHIAPFRAKLEDLGYTPSRVVYHLRFVAKIDLWLLRRKERLWWLNEQKVDQFLAQLRKKRRAGYRGARSGLRLLLRFLRDVGVVAPKTAPIAGSPSQRLTDRYRAFLKEERGLDRATIYNYSRHIDRFLTEHFGIGRAELRSLGTSQITAFVRRHAPRGGLGLAAQMVTGLRSFFRFAQLRGLITSDLAAAVPAVPTWQGSGPPKHLSREQVQRVLGACERTTVRGKRDYAILLLLARLGLRAGEIVALQLEDVDWVNAQLTVRSKKGDGWARLPLANRRRASPGSLLASKATNFIPKRLRSGIRPPYAVRSLWSRFGFGKNGD